MIVFREIFTGPIYSFAKMSGFWSLTFRKKRKLLRVNIFLRSMNFTEIKYKTYSSYLIENTRTSITKTDPVQGKSRYSEKLTRPKNTRLKIQVFMMLKQVRINASSVF